MTIEVRMKDYKSYLREGKCEHGTRVFHHPAFIRVEGMIGGSHVEERGHETALGIAVS